jgi:hypothetical protein
MKTLTFEQRVFRRWLTSILLGALGFFISEGLTTLIIVFVVFVAIPLSADAQKIILTCWMVLIGVNYFFAWGFRGIQKENVDTTIKYMGPLQRKVIIAQLQEEEKGNGTEKEKRP